MGADRRDPDLPFAVRSEDPAVRMLSEVSAAQAEFIAGADARALAGTLLRQLLSLSGSEYGFVAEVDHGPDGAPFLKTHALTNIAWDAQTRALYEVHEARGLEFRNLKTLFGHALVTEQPVFANDVATDPRSGGRPIGHPVMRCFLGVPLRRGGELVAMVGLANRPGGYDESLLRYLAPILETCTSLVQGMRIDRRRRHAEDDLRAANARLSAILSAVEAGVLLESEGRRIVLVNQRFCDLFGVPVAPESLVGADCANAADTAKDLFAEPDAFLARVRDILAARAPVLGEVLRMRDGTVLERDYVPVRVEGVDRGHYWQYRDVTRREHDAAQLRKREEEAARLAMVAARTSNGVVITDATGVITWVNDGFTRMTGYGLEDVVGRRPGAFLQGPGTDARTVERMRQAIRAGRAFVVEVLNFHRSGRPYWVRVDAQPVLGADGALANYIAIETDVTDRVEQDRREGRLAHLQWVVREVLTSFLHEQTTASVVPLMLSRVGRALDADRAFLARRRGDGDFARVEQWTSGAAAALPPDAALPPTVVSVLSAGRVFAGLHDQAASASCLAMPVLLRGALEAVVGFEATGGPRTWRPEEVAVIQALAEGFARAREREEGAARLREAADRAESASRAKSEFLASMSHEIRTPMSAVVGYADLLSRPGLDAARADEWRGHLRRNAAYLMSLVDDVLDLSRIEAGKVSPRLEDVDPAAVLAEVDALLRPRAEERMLALRVAAEGDLPPTLRTDPTRLQQILVNLVGNALKFTDRGRVELVLSSQRGSDGRLRLRYRVTDTGVGIPPEKLGALFQPFAQAHGADETRRGGTGLGLAISRRFAWMLGGDIDVVSVPGEGSTFTLVLDLGPVPDAQLRPAPRELPRAAAAGAPGAGASLAGRRVLVVDDSPDNRRILRFVLEEKGATVEEAEHGALAMERLAAAGPRFDLVVLDMQMPVMDGYQTAKAIRDRGLSTPVLALTAYAMAGDAERCLEAGCDRYLAKPIVPAELAATADRLLGGAAAAVPPAEVAADDRHAAARSLADDPAFAPLIAEYVSGLAELARAVRDAGATGDVDALRRAAHRTRGTADSYGFPALARAASRCEEAMASRPTGTALAEAAASFLEAVDAARTPRRR